MFYFWMTVLVVVNLAFWALNFVGVPGNWLIAAATAVVAWWQWDRSRSIWDQAISLPVLVLVVAFAVVGEVVEFAAGSVGTKALGGSKRGCAGAAVGALIGVIPGTLLIPIPLVGSLVGACVGAFLGAWLLELNKGRTMRDSLKLGTAAGTGRLAGTVAKVILGALMWVVVTVAVYWP